MSQYQEQMKTENIDSLNSSEELTLSTDKRENLLSGITVSEEPQNTDYLENFSEELHKTKEATDFGEAWITSIIPPETDNKKQPEDTTGEIAVEFMLKNGITFWESYSIDNSYIPEDHDFLKVIHYTGNTILTISNVLGESIPVKYKDSEEHWRVAMENLDMTEDEETQELTANDPLAVMLQVYIMVFIGSLFLTFDISKTVEMTWVYGTPIILFMVSMLFLSQLYECYKP